MKRKLIQYDVFKKIEEDSLSTAQYELTEAEASLESALAAHETARLNLEFTTITAPLTGRIGQRQVDVGNLVVQDQTLLATIIPVEKVNVLFDMDERTVLRLRRLQQAGQLSVPVFAQFGDQTGDQGVAEQDDIGAELCGEVLDEFGDFPSLRS